MIPRYTRPEMGLIWSDENKFRTWLQVEIAASETLAEAGLVPKSAARAIKSKGDFDLERIQEIEAEVKHDVIAFTTAVAEKVGPESRWLHYGLTSNDVVDTAQALLVKQASDVIHADIEAFLEVLKRRAFEFQHTPQIGRTHGVHAEPITFGLKVANWYSEVQRDLERFELAAEQMRVGKLSGAVGNGAHLDPEYEESICERLGLKVAAISSQVIQRDRHAFYLATLAVIASTLDKIATEIRHLQRTEVREAEEYFSEKQKGSSAMPHKRNPVTCEQISGLARVVRSNAQAALENVALWHERDISHSSVERIILPDSTILVDYLLAKTTNLIDTLLVYPKRMLANLNATGGLVFSGQLLLDLVEAGVLREDAYRMVQRNAMRAWQEEMPFRDMIFHDDEIINKVDNETLERAFDLDRQLRNVDKIFLRVFGPNGDGRPRAKQTEKTTARRILEAAKSRRKR
ncbi:MAG TPA: adenylosuccinate lyase [candidate division Zixibacteria bacterium]|nr:adenylosuccinate lyase [candidate division Zixibacteria bacterium]